MNGYHGNTDARTGKSRHVIPNMKKKNQNVENNSWTYFFWTMTIQGCWLVHVRDIPTNLKPTLERDLPKLIKDWADVVMSLMDGLFHPGYHLFVDNFYSGPLFSHVVKTGKVFPQGLQIGLTKKDPLDGLGRTTWCLSSGVTQRLMQIINMLWGHRRGPRWTEEKSEWEIWNC